MTPNVDSVLAAEANARRKWKGTGDPVWAYAEAALAWVRGSKNVDPAIQAVLEGDSERKGLTMEYTEDEAARRAAARQRIDLRLAQRRAGVRPESMTTNVHRVGEIEAVIQAGEHAWINIGGSTFHFDDEAAVVAFAERVLKAATNPRRVR